MSVVPLSLKCISQMRIGTISVVKTLTFLLTFLLERPEVEVVPKIERNRIRQLLLINK